MRSEAIRKRLVIAGKVQGVFFRDSIRQAAGNEGVSGWATNRDDGAVEVRAGGSTGRGCRRWWSTAASGR